MASNILVLGAGELGISMLTSLARRKPPTAKLTVLLRTGATSSPSAKKAADISNFHSLGISLLAGDIAAASVVELAALFEPYDLVISCLGFGSGPGFQLKICEAVLKAGVKRFFPWQFGLDYDTIGRGSAQDLFDEQLDVRDLLRGQAKTEWVIVSAGMFVSFLFEAYVGIVDLGGEGAVVRALGSWNNQVTVTTVEDIGRLTAEIVFTEPRIKNQVVFIAGETLSCGQLADLVEDITGKKVRREEWSLETLKERLRQDPKDSVNKYRVVFAEGNGVAWDIEQTFNWQKAIQTDDVRSWVQKHIMKNRVASLA
jgi:hypothetical protein